MGERNYRLTGKLLDDGGSSTTFLGFVLNGADGTEEITVSANDSLDEKLNFYADIQLDPGKRYYYWAIAANAIGDTRGNSRKLTTPIAEARWWSQASLQTGGWRTSWLGSFRPYESGWIYHLKLGWAYAQPDGDDGLWLWISTEGWLWTQPGAFPYLWRHRSKNWVYLLGNENGRPFFFEWFERD